MLGPAGGVRWLLGLFLAQAGSLVTEVLISQSRGVPASTLPEGQCAGRGEGAGGAQRA